MDSAQWFQPWEHTATAYVLLNRVQGSPKIFAPSDESRCEYYAK
jgi:hypothetical protein